MKTDIEYKKKGLTGYTVVVTVAIMFHFLIVSVLTVFSLVSINFWIVSVLIILSLAVVLWLIRIIASSFSLNILNVSSVSYILINFIVGIVGCVGWWLCEHVIPSLNDWRVHLSFFGLILFAIPIASFVFSFHYIAIRLKEEKNFVLLKGIGGVLNIHLSWFYCIVFHEFLLKTVPFYQKAYEKTFIFFVLKLGYYVWIGVISILIVLILSTKGFIKER